MSMDAWPEIWAERERYEKEIATLEARVRTLESTNQPTLPWKRFGETPPKDGAPLSVPVIDYDNEFIVSGYFVKPNIVKSALLGTVYVGSDDQYLLDTDLLATVPRT